MNFSSKKILIAAIVSGLLASGFTYQTFSLFSKKAAAAPLATSLRNIKAGQLVTSKDVKMMSVKKKVNLSQTFIHPKQVIGKKALKAIKRGDIFLANLLTEKRAHAFGDLPPGYRASTIALSLPDEILEFINSGSRIDILFTDTSNKQVSSTKTIMKVALTSDTDQVRSVVGYGMSCSSLSFKVRSSVHAGVFMSTA